jgi:NADPH:quinone reductase-like Zn-dependent oxidoreductase
MKAIRFHEHDGGPGVLRFEIAPDPECQSGEVLVRVRALNHLDLWQRRGPPRVTIPMPHISGSNVAGEVVASSVSGISAGQRVMLRSGVSCGRDPSRFLPVGTC